MVSAMSHAHWVAAVPALASAAIKVTECMVRVSERHWLGTCVLVGDVIKVTECMVRAYRH
jgi:hypothetical protein